MANVVLGPTRDFGCQHSDAAPAVAMFPAIGQEIAVNALGSELMGFASIPGLWFKRRLVLVRGDDQMLVWLLELLNRT